jgi:membrane protein
VVGIRGQHQVAFDRAAGNEPQGPTELPKRSWWAVLKRTVREFGKDNLLDWVAALTYYSVLSIFPAVIVLTVVLDLLKRLRLGPPRWWLGWR